ncbi:MAG: ATP-dependent metallopeptidase FtsH/Yme1/Tma family protein [Chloroflexi bacterium]|nr:ATP-dependent metallopeptidase FtsH/Yme1/Tma family protein [Chloroflexota bacterium]MBM3175482.1 ATP-dependent metallopeptidase FtsH/Yme1/Tma family protein [Chloroflexota bacterium]MBM4449467.1 ATP-dependent metallopeptidase FtsH/Yme1/Tma family protein [Chloroflexota bacterium]
MKTKWWQGSLFYLLILVAIIALAFSFFPVNKAPKEVDYYTFVNKARDGEIDTIEQNGTALTGLKNGEKVAKSSFVGSTKELMDTLKESGIALGEGGVKFLVKTGGFDWGSVMISFLPLILFGALLFFLFRSARGANTQAFNFARSRARLAGGNKPTVTFDDVAGVDEAKAELQEIVEFLKSPQKFLALGARIPRGVLLVGPPGCGKTLIAKAVAGQAGVPFYSISGSEFVEMFVGVGASRVRDLFDQAKRNSPCIVFVDEIDAVGRHRGAGLGGGHDEREQTLNQILVEMDGFDSSVSVIVLAATNRPDILDPALLRPGRFDRHVVIDQPDINGRKAILEVHAKGKPLAKDIDFQTLAKETAGFSGADLANLINEGAILAARHNHKEIHMKELEESIDRVIAGPEKKGRVISQKEKEIIAHHETGHALAAKMLPNADPVHKISIVARGMMGGWTRFLPTEDRHLWTVSQFEDRLVVSLAGRAAEEITFGEVTTGAQNDLEQATSLARKMVTEYGMSSKLGPRTFGKREELVFLGREIHEQRNYGEKVAMLIDKEVDALIQKAYTTAKKILTDNKERLKLIADRLMAKETIEEFEFEALLKESLPAQLQASPAS